MDFKEKLRLALNGMLPGHEAHKILAPSYRQKELDDMSGKSFFPRLAAVMLLFREIEGIPHLILIRRSDYVGIHSGQMGFPGGRWEESDLDFAHTAFREVEEEIGIPARNIELLGQMSDLYIPPSNFLMKIFVGYLTDIPFYDLDVREVSEIYEIPFPFFQDEKNIREGEFPGHPDKALKKAPYFHVSDQVRIWGASAMALSELLQILKEQDD